jgi:hypothetical protein
MAVVEFRNPLNFTAHLHVRPGAVDCNYSPPPPEAEPDRASHTADCGSQGARVRAQGDRAVPLRLGRGNVATHFVGGGTRSHRFSLTDGDSSDSTLGCIKMNSASYPKKS